MAKNFIAAVSLSFLVASGATTTYAGTCTSDADCPQDQVCSYLTNQCVQCVYPDDCAQGLICKDNQCVPPECAAHCDCAQGSFCYYGKCLTDPKTPVWCCARPGCPPGRWCFESSGGKGTCAENPEYLCADACDCGPAHACLDIAGVGYRCIKDLDDPWMPGGIALFGVIVPTGAATYCCGDPLCHAGRMAYGEMVENFSCYNRAEQSTSNFCGGPPCFSGNNCDPGESCVETEVNGPTDVLPIGSTCNPKGAHCVSNAVAEAVFGYSPAELLPACGQGCFPGQKCEVGWKPGGPYLYQRVVGTCSSCGNGACEAWENFHSCVQDCIATNSCGDGICSNGESPKNCAQDCTQVICGDGSCAASEVSSCAQDCGCPESPTFSDYRSVCGDGYCDPNPASLENCATCVEDCGTGCAVPVAQCKDVTVTADANCLANASIDDGSYVPGGVTFTLSQTPLGPYPLGTTAVTLAMRTSENMTTQCSGVVSVRDGTPPQITDFSVIPPSTWPPMQQLVNVTINYGATDSCSTATCQISSVTCNETISTSDYRIIDAHHVKLLAARTGRGSGRLYRITVLCSDAFGNSIAQVATVQVPHDRRQGQISGS
jgi:hypothetical protein